MSEKEESSACICDERVRWASSGPVSLKLSQAAYSWTCFTHGLCSIDKRTVIVAPAASQRPRDPFADKLPRGFDGMPRPVPRRGRSGF